MSLLSKASALVLFVFAALPFAACKGSTADSGPCAGYCQIAIACTDTTGSGCTLSDPAGAQSACVSACEQGFAALSPADNTTLTACFECGIQASAGMCPSKLPANTCQTECNSAAAMTASTNFGKAAAAVPPTPASECTNGMNALGGSACSGGGDGTTMCTSQCCNGSTCTTPDVALACTGSGLSTCTCTAGKNKGKSVQAPNCVGDVWTLCNL